MVHFVGQKSPLLIVDGSLKDSATIHHSGKRTQRMMTTSAMPQAVLSLRVTTSAMSHLRSRYGGAEEFDVEEGDETHRDEDQHRDRGSQAQVEIGEQVVVGEDRDRPRLVLPLGQYVDVVEYPEGVQGPEQQRHQDGGLHQRQDYLGEALPGGGAVH